MAKKPAKKTQKKAVKKAAKKVGKKSTQKKAEPKKKGIVPLGDRVLVAIAAEEILSPSGIIIPDTAKQERPERGVVVAVGEGKRTENGTLIMPRVSVGDIVLFSKYGFDEVKNGGKDYVIVSEGSILAIINE